MEATEEVLGRIRSSFAIKQRELWPDEESAPGTLFHYTSSEGLVGISSSRKFFLTDVLSSSDRSEVIYGTGLAKAILRDNAEHPLCKQMLAAYAEHPLAGLGDTYFLHSLSFCARQDVLTQWRAYSTTGGFALGVNFEKIYQRAQGKEFAISRIVYDEITQKDILHKSVGFGCEVFDEVLPKADAMAPEDRNAALSEVMVGTAMLLLTSIIQFKHPAFESEEEWRLFRLDPAEELPEVRYRMCGPRLVPYLEVSFDADLITDIIRSPGLWPTSTDYALKRLGASLGPHVRIGVSELPV